MQTGFGARDLHRGRGQFADLLRPGIADGIGDRDHIDAGLEQLFRQPQHFLRVNGTDDRTAQRHRDRGIHHRLVRAGVAQLAEPLDVGDRGFARAVGIGLAVLFGRRDHRRDFGDAGGQRLVDAALVQRQRDAVGAGQRGDGRDDVAHIGELRKGLCGQERADLEMPHARGIFVADPALLGGGRRKFLHQLQAVAQAHFAQDDLVVGIDVPGDGSWQPHAALSVEDGFACRVRRERPRCRRRAPALSALRRYCRRSTRPAMPERGTARHRR